MPVSPLMTSDRKRSGTVVSAKVPWMLRSSDMVFALVLAYPRGSVCELLHVFVGQDRRAGGQRWAARTIAAFAIVTAITTETLRARRCLRDLCVSVVRA